MVFCYYVVLYLFNVMVCYGVVGVDCGRGVL